MTEPLNWDEFRIVRAIAETESLGGAAEMLGLTHSTMFRRLTALEARLGFRLFDRQRGGYRPTAAGEDMVALATLMGDTISEFERRIVANDLPLSGLVRLSTVETLGCIVLPPLLAEFRAAHPALNLELNLSESPVDLFEGEIDLALRVVRGSLLPELTTRRVGANPWAIYAAPALAPPGAAGRLAGLPWVVPTAHFGPPQAHRWLARNVEPTRHCIRAASLIAVAEMAAAGLGAALLPRHLGDEKPGLVRIGEADGEVDGEIWLAATPQALRKARVRALFDFLAEALERRLAKYEGEKTTF